MPNARAFLVNLSLPFFFWAVFSSALDPRALAQSVQDKSIVSIVPPVLRLAPLNQAADSPVVTALAIDPTGSLAAAAGDDHVIRLFSLSDTLSAFPQSALLAGHRDWVQAIEFSSDGNLLATCAKDGKLQVWKKEKDAVSAATQGELDPSDRVQSKQEWKQLWSIEVAHALYCLKFVGNESLLVAGFDPAIYRLDLATLQWNVDHRSESADVRTLAVSEDSSYLAYGGRDGVVRLKRLSKTGRTLTEGSFAVAAHNHRVRALCFSNNHRMLYSVGEDRRLVGIELTKQTVEYQNDLGAGRLMAIVRLTDERYAVSGSDNTIRIVKPIAGDLQEPSTETDSEAKLLGIKLIGHDGTIAVLRASGDHLFSGSFDTTIRSWDIATALSGADAQGRFVHPVSAQYEDSSAREPIR
jgi:WD40 repeat protein